MTVISVVYGGDFNLGLFNWSTISKLDRWMMANTVTVVKQRNSMRDLLSCHFVTIHNLIQDGK